MRTAIYFVGALIAGCGAHSPTNVASSEPSNNPLAAALKTMQGAKKDLASATFAVFGGEKLKDEQELSRLVDSVNHKTFGTALPASKRHRPFVVCASVDKNLPLDMGALSQNSKDADALLKGSQYVAFVRFLAPPVGDSLHVQALGNIVSALVDRASIIADLSTQRVYTPASWVQWRSSADWIADQIVPDIQRNEDGSVTFYTRGMAKFGLPDVEWFGRNPKSARADFGLFQEAIAEMRQSGPYHVGSTLKGRKLVACKRPIQAIEKECVGL